jgi:hypothetical protein
MEAATAFGRRDAVQTDGQSTPIMTLEALITA